MSEVTTFQALADSFETRYRDDESKFVCMKDGAHEDVQDLVWAIHDGFNLFPNDWTYRAIAEMAENLAYSEGDIGTAADQTIPISTYELFRWLADWSLAQCYVNDVLAEGGSTEISAVISRAMFNVLCEIGSQIEGFIEGQNDE